jgi:hypothetical protein
MPQQFRLEIELPPAEYLHRIERFAADWRESRFPSALRKRNIFGCRVRMLSADMFEVRLRPLTRGPEFLCRGQITPVPSGSSLGADLVLTSGTKVSLAIFNCLMLAMFIWSGSILFGVAGGGFLAMVQIAMLQSVGERTKGDFRELLESIAVYGL